jgi:hypothetical protein
LRQKNRDTLNCIAITGKFASSHPTSFGEAHSRREKLSTIFVDNTVDGLHKEKVSGVGESIFCSAIKKYAPRFPYFIQRLIFEGRVVARFPGYSRDRFVTIVNEQQCPARVVESRKQAESARIISDETAGAPKYAPGRTLRISPARIECGT